MTTTSYAMRIRMRYCIDDGAVSFLATPVGTDEIPLVTFEREVGRIVSEETESLRAEIAKLQGIINGLAQRVADQSELLVRRAEKDALERLEAWQAQETDYRAYDIRQDRVLLTGNPSQWVYAYRCKRDYGNFTEYPTHVVIVGTDDQPATLDECIDAALMRWQELYGTP